MKTTAALLTTNSPPFLRFNTRTILYSTSSQFLFSLTLRFKPARVRRLSLRVSCSLENADSETASNDSIQNLELLPDSQPGNGSLKVEVRNPGFLANLIPPPKLSLSDQVFFLLVFIACTTCAAFASLVVAAVPTLFAMRRAAISLSKLADTAREELPSTMTAIRLSGMEISDLILELSDMSEEIAGGVKKSTQAVQAAEAGIRKIGSIAHQQTMSMIQERASLPIISLQPVVSGAAKKTSRAVSQATKTILNIISRGGLNSAGEDDNPKNRIES
ncbi:hypothetical protein F511_01777 [Dorcoceras hygrometricum]|uniref:Uncharacterized protein n=1 Tax=Dorcoceras hygrometricum TaxID=472368 RepID=A0A2Z7AR33_9LAMI|nr:hypothetical protein F511_01777 [Dorcoceras hygrometricum]